MVPNMIIDMHGSRYYYLYTLLQVCIYRHCARYDYIDIVPGVIIDINGARYDGQLFCVHAETFIYTFYIYSRIRLSRTCRGNSFFFFPFRNSQEQEVLRVTLFVCFVCCFCFFALRKLTASDFDDNFVCLFVFLY